MLVGMLIAFSVPPNTFCICIYLMMAKMGSKHVV